MRRGKGKGKKQTVTASREDNGNDAEEMLPRRRGRPQKAGDIKEEEVVTIEDDNYNSNGSVSDDKHLGIQGVAENGKKRKMTVQSEEDFDTVKEENSDASKARNGSSSSLSVGYRPNGSRRKNKPRRAAEAVVECIGV